MTRRPFALIFLIIGLVGLSVGCTFPGWVTPEQTEVIEEPDPEPGLDLSGVLIGSWEEWSESKGRTGYLYAFYDDGHVLVSHSEMEGIVLSGLFEFLGQDSFVVRWNLMGSSLQFQEMIWRVISLKFNQVIFDIGNDSTLTLRQGLDEQPFIQPGLQQTQSIQFE